VPDLLSILSNAANSLGANRVLTATISNNIQNANTPGYSRQRATLAETAPAEYVTGAWVGRGVTLQGVTQSRNKFVEAQVPATLSSAAFSATESEALQSLRALDPGAAGGLGEALSGFYTAMRGVAQNAGDLGLRTAALGAARNVAYAFNRTAAAIDAARDALDTNLSGLVDEVNVESRAVAQLNLEIQGARATGAEPNDLLDLRQGHLDRLAALTGATPVATSDGDVNLVLPGGQVLVGGIRAATLSALPDPANGGHLAVHAVGVDGASSTLSNASLSGTVGGTLAVRDGALLTAQQSVDQLAWDVTQQVNAAHAGGYGLDAVNGRALFTAGATSAGAAAAMATALSDPRSLAASASAAGVPGDGSNATLLVATETASLSGGKDAQSTLSGIISAFGAEAQRAKAYAEQDQALSDHVQGMRESYSGVSIDEELVEMQRAQRAFEAITKVILAADEMLKTLMSLR
jgi:flagellar hook-associated protein 1 FlgK